MNAFAHRGTGNFGRILKRGSRPRSTVGAMIGTMICFVAFVQHYMSVNDESKVWVWFGIRSDGRCGRDYSTEHISETTCGKGLCCSSHGWCGTGEEYCSRTMGCQSGCDPAGLESGDMHGEDGDADGEHGMHYHMDDDVYRHHANGEEYDDDVYRHHSSRYRRGAEYGHYEDHYDDYHHRYDNHYEGHPELEGHHELEGHLEGHDEGHHERHEHHEEEDRADGPDLVFVGDGPELLGMSEKRHLGEGDGIPLEQKSSEQESSEQESSDL